MGQWLWIILAVAALILLYAFNPLGRKGRKNRDMSRRTGKGMIENFDEEQNFIDKYSQ